MGLLGCVKQAVTGRDSPQMDQDVGLKLPSSTAKLRRNSLWIGCGLSGALEVDMKSFSQER